MSVIQEIPKTPAEILKQLENNRLSMGVSVHPGEFENTIKLVCISRPPDNYRVSENGKNKSKQGNHTFSITAFLRPLEWMIKDVTPMKAVQLLIADSSNPDRDFHRDLQLAMGISFPRGAHHIRELWMETDEAHKKMHSMLYQPEMICPYITRYVTLSAYLYNYLPLATSLSGINKGQGEGSALSELKEHQDKGIYDPKKLVSNLSKLFDEEAILSHLSADNTLPYKPKYKILEKILGPEYPDHAIIAFQILGLNRMLDVLPRLHKIYYSIDYPNQLKRLIETIMPSVYSNDERLESFIPAFDKAMTLIKEMKSSGYQVMAL